MALIIEIKAADGTVSRTRLEAGRNRFSVRLGDSYRILDDQTGLSPEGLAVKRVDNNLIVDGLDTAGSSVEFAEFYNICSAGSPCELTIESSAGSTPVAITPGTQPIGALADGSFVLYDPKFAETAPPTPSLGDGTMVRNVLYGVGGLAVVGLAAGGGGGGGGGGDDDGTRPDGSLKLTSSQFTNSRTPTISGQGEPGSRVIVRIDTDGDGIPNVTYGTTVAPDFTWSINLANAVPESGALPAGGLPEASNVGINSSTSAGVASLPTFVLRYDGTTPLPPVVDPITTDNVVNASEKQNGFVISGTADATEAGGTVILLSDGQAFATAVVQDDGRWQTAALVGTAVPVDGGHTLSAAIEDRAGNRSEAKTSAFSVNTAPPPLQGLVVAGGDNFVSRADAASVGFSGRTDPNASVQVQWSNGTKVVTANGSGDWSTAFTGAEVPDSAGANFPYSITATNAIGNMLVQPGQIWVDRVAPVAATIGGVEGDNVVTLAERGDGVPVGGQAEAGAEVRVTWGTTTHAARADGNGNWLVNFASGELPAVVSPGGPTTLTAVVLDPVLNSSPTAQVAVTIEQPFAAPVISTVEGDNNVNAAEAADGVVLSGTVQAGAAGVTVNWAGVVAAATVSGTSWSAPFAAGQVPADGPSTVTATVTGAGGGASAALGVAVDRVAPGAPNVPPVTGDDSISTIDRVGGIDIGGQAEPGARVSVALGSAGKVTTAAPTTGAWTVTFEDAEIPAGPSTVGMSVSAYDAAGNASAPTARTITIEALAGVASPSIQAETSGAFSYQTPSSIESLLAEESQTSGRFA